jgi:ATP-dependent Lhr-like helicase
LGEQFALPEAVGLLREANTSAPNGRMEVVSACDPLNLVGIITPGDKVPAVLGNRVVFQDGAPVASLESGKVVNRSGADQPTMAQAYSLLQMPRLGASARQGAWN